MTLVPCPLRHARPLSLAAATDEALRLFFPLAALHAALWPLLWALLWQFGLPFAADTAPGQWHAQEMIFGSFGAALIGFLVSALPEWTETRTLHGWPLLGLAAFWGLPRIAGFFGAQAMIVLAGVFDLLWLLLLAGYAATLAIRLRTLNLAGFVFFLTALALAAGWLRWSMLTGDFDRGEQAIRLALAAFAGLLGLALARITVPVTNRMLDPDEETSPYRPHPARVNLAPGLAALLTIAEAASLSPAVTGYLAMATGAAFLDRVAEGFVGREGLRPELAGLWLSSAFTGLGLLIIGLAGVGLPLPVLAGIHLLTMGGLGLGVLQVLSIAGLLHTGQPLQFHRRTRAALLLVVFATLSRIAPELDIDLSLPGGPHALSALLWATALTLWLSVYLPLLWSPHTLEQKSC